jgi:plasmid segregation protein ParM
MQKFKVVGMDNGYDYFKLVFGPGENENVLYPSAIYEPSSSPLIKNAVAREEYKIDKMVVNYEGNNYYVGAYAIDQDPRGGDKDFSADKFKFPSEIAKFLAGMALYSQESDIKIENLVLGLNIENYEKYKEDMIKVFKGETFEYSCYGKNYKLKIDNVICIPQGIGAYYDQILDWEGVPDNDKLLEARYALIDSGGQTLDAFIAKGIDVVTGTEIGEKIGTSDAFKEVADKIGKKIPYTLIEQDYKKGKNKTFWEGKYHNVEMACKQSFSNLSKRIYNTLINEWNKHLSRTEFILLCGGGAKYIEAPLSELFDLDLKVVDNPQFSNANGYYKLGVYATKED